MYSASPPLFSSSFFCNYSGICKKEAYYLALSNNAGQPHPNQRRKKKLKIAILWLLTTGLPKKIALTG
jgi:hypothetical protein